MPEILDHKQVFTLKEVAESVKRTLAQRYTSFFWVKAEMNKLNHYAHSGHCYPDMVQKESGKVVAQMRGVIWAGDFARIESAMRKVTGESLREGFTLLFQASIQFDHNYGLTLQIRDVDPVYAMGEMEKEKNETIQRLKELGLFEANKQTKMPLLPKRLAIISVETSKGYADFTQLLQSRMKNYKVEMMLFPSLLQGEKAAKQIEIQLLRIKNVVHHFDAVAIIRGGGGEIGLNAYNDYQLALAICTFPIPVITGIGHATNLTVTEMVAHTNAITPSELAGIIMAKFEHFNQFLHQAGKALGNAGILMPVQKEYLKYQQLRLNTVSGQNLKMKQSTLRNTASMLRQESFVRLSLAGKKLDEAMLRHNLMVFGFMRDEKQRLHVHLDSLQRKSPLILKEKQSFIASLQRMIGLLNPELVLKRGYSISYAGGKVVFDAGQLTAGTEVITKLAQGSFKARVLSVENEKKE